MYTTLDFLVVSNGRRFIVAASPEIFYENLWLDIFMKILKQYKFFFFFFIHLQLARRYVDKKYYSLSCVNAIFMKKQYFFFKSCKLFTLFRIKKKLASTHYNDDIT